MEEQKRNSSYEDIANKVIGVTQKLARNNKIRLKRTSGLTVDELRPDDKIIFYSLFPNDYSIPKDKFFLNCILFAVQVICTQDGAFPEGNKLQDIISEEYSKGKSETSKRKIEAFMSLDGRGNEMFFKDLSWLYLGLVKKKKVNAFALVQDLINWDNIGRDRWINSIIRIKQNELIG